MIKKEKFLLVMPDYSDFPKLFLDNLEKEGFETYLITDKVSKFRYKGTESIKNFFVKNILRNKEYKQDLINRHFLEDLNKSISAIEGELDYILVIRPDIFPIPFIQNLKKKTKKLIAYQWDGIEKFPEVKNYFNLFDSFFCFENVESQPNIKSITNFYFDHLPPAHKEYNTEKPRLYFVGLYWKSREEKIDKFIAEVSDLPVDLSIFIQYFKEPEKRNDKIKYIQNRISFQENLELVKDSDILLDFVDPLHNGLSIRFFEGMYYKKKVITDNIMVKKYNFYHPDNIFVVENNNYNNIDQFLRTPYHELPEEIVQQYGFSNWIREIIQDEKTIKEPINMNNSIKISVIVPCYNQAVFLDDCINSLINQTYSNWECILVNDGSTDNTEDIALNWQKKDNRIKYIKKINGGLSSARNAGIQNITGDFVQFLDCDDYLYNQKFEKSVKEINNQTNAIVITDFQRFDSATQTVLPPHCILKTEYFSQKEILLKWDNTFSIPIHCAIFSRDIVEKYKFNEELKAKEDWFFWLQAYENAPETHFVPEYLLAYRMNSAGMTHNLFFMQENRIKALDKLEQVIADKDLLREFFKQDLLATMKENLQLMERIKLLGYKRTMKYKINKVLKVIGIKKN